MPMSDLEKQAFYKAVYDLANQKYRAWNDMNRMRLSSEANVAGDRKLKYIAPGNPARTDSAINAMAPYTSTQMNPEISNLSPQSRVQPEGGLPRYWQELALWELINQSSQKK